MKRILISPVNNKNVNGKGFDTPKQSYRKNQFGSLFQRVNIYTLKYLVETVQQPYQLREKLLKYTKLNLPHITDIQIDIDFMSEEQVKQQLQDDNDETPIKYYLDNKKQIDMSSLSNFQDISDEQYGKVILSMLEVLGTSIESRVKYTLNEFKLSQDLQQQLQSMLKLKSKYFQIMMQRTYEITEDEENLIQSDKKIYKSTYDETIDQVYKEYVYFFKSESKESLDKTLSKIIAIIDSILSIVPTESSDNNEKNESAQQNILTYKEYNNLIQLRDLLTSSNEYFYETLKPLAERQFFFWMEVVRLNGENLDKISIFPLMIVKYSKEQYQQIIQNSFCALANSQGGNIFIGIHNIHNQVKADELKDIVQNNYLDQLKKLFLDITPRVNYEIKLLNVINCYKYAQRPKNTFIMNVIVKPRKAKEAFYVLRNEHDKFYFLRNQTLNQRIKLHEVKQLIELRNAETDEPNLQDYCQFKFNFNPKQSVSQDVKVNNSLIGSPEDELSKIFEEEFEDCDDSENTSEIKELKKISINENRNLFQEGRSLNNSYQKNNIRNLSEESNRNRFDSYSGDFSRRNSCDQSFQFKNKNSDSFRKENEKSSLLSKYKLIPHSSGLDKREQIFYHSAINGLENWKKQILRDYLNQETTLSFKQFVQSPLVSKLHNFEWLTFKNSFLIFRIDSQSKHVYKETITKSFNENQIPFEYIGNVNNFTILHIDREKYNYQIDRIITPITMKYSYRNIVVQGFDFDKFEIKYIQNPNEAYHILDQVFKALGIEATIKYGSGKFFVSFPNIHHFLQGHNIVVKIRQIFETDQSASKVFVSFHQHYKN